MHSLEVATALVTGAAEALADWPHAFQHIVMSIQSSATSTSGVRRTFGALYGVIYEELGDPEFQFLRDAFEDHVHDNWWGLVCKRHRRFRARTQSERSRITVHQAAVAADVSPAVIRHCVQGDLLEWEQIPLPCGRHMRTLRTSDVVSLRDLFANALTLSQAAGQLALPERRLRDLIAAKVVRVLVSRHAETAPARWAIAQSEIKRLSVPVLTLPSGVKGIRFVDVMRFWRLRAGEVVALVQALLGRRLEAYGPLGHAVPLGRIELNPGAVREWLGVTRASADAPLTVDQAARWLGVKQEVCYGLLRLGLLRSQPINALGLRVSIDALEIFCAEYISLVALAKNAQLAPRRLLPLVSARPVCGPTVDGTRQYFYRRADLRGDSSDAIIKSKIPGDLRQDLSAGTVDFGEKRLT
ncbi:MAG: hypothetical protein PHO64_08560 [Thiomonas sp.]|nr:hypothetical protein [Thiomonas sp.]